MYTSCDIHKIRLLIYYFIPNNVESCSTSLHPRSGNPHQNKKGYMHYKITFHYCNVKDNTESNVTDKADANYPRSHWVFKNFG